MATRTKIWGDFKRWCEARNLKPLPAHPWSIAAYLRWLERHKAAGQASGAVDVIAREHLLKSARVPTRHPTVQRTLDLIARRASTAVMRSNLFDDDDAGPQSTDVSKKAPVPSEPAAAKHRTMRATPRLKSRRPKPAK